MTSDSFRNLLAALITAIIPVANASAGTPRINWHPPATPVERSLDAMLKAADRDMSEVDNLFKGRGATAFQQTVDYRTMLTQPLLAAIRQAEADQVKRDCDGQYTEGDECGLDFLPIECAQDTHKKYVYWTEMQNEQEARIAYAWSSDNASPVATYKLVKQAHQWKIDGIKCGQGATFNMPS